MTIRSLEKDGEIFFGCYINLTSKNSRTLRVQRQKEGLKTQDEAKRWERKLLLEAQAELTRREQQGASWQLLIERWESALRRGAAGTRPVLETTIEDNVRVLERYTSSWMKIAASAITPADVRALFDNLIEVGLSKSRVKALKSSITGAFRWGIESRLIRGVDRPPTLGISLGSLKSENAPEILTLTEVRQMLEAAKSLEHEWYPIWVMASLTGMRSGELQALEWSDVDLENNLITVSKSYNGRLKKVKSTKAGYWRKVPINSELSALLIELRVRSQGVNHVLPRITRWRRGEAAKVLRGFLEGLGLPSVRFHTLRACFATHLLQAGVPSPTVKKIAGWTEEKVMNRYVRLAGIDVSGATDRLTYIRPQDAMERAVVNMTEYRMTGGAALAPSTSGEPEV